MSPSDALAASPAVAMIYDAGPESWGYYPIGNLPGNFRTVELGNGSFPPEGFSLVLQPAGMVEGVPGCFDLYIHLGDLEADCLEF